jgi:hypothetical protein
METAKWPEAADRYRNRAGHAGQDSLVEQDPATGYHPDIHELPGILVFRPAPTEPQVTDVTPTSTARVPVGDHQRILTRMAGQPLLRLLVERHNEFTGHIAEYAPLPNVAAQPLCDIGRIPVRPIVIAMTK